MTSATKDKDTIIHEFIRERVRQVAKHGTQGDEQHGPHDWIAIICKHAGLGVVLPPDTLGMALDRFRKQMVSVGALAVAAVEWADREIERLAHDRR